MWSASLRPWRHWKNIRMIAKQPCDMYVHCWWNVFSTIQMVLMFGQVIYKHMQCVVFALHMWKHVTWGCSGFWNITGSRICDACYHMLCILSLQCTLSMVAVETSLRFIYVDLGVWKWDGFLKKIMVQKQCSTMIHKHKFWFVILWCFLLAFLHLRLKQTGAMEMTYGVSLWGKKCCSMSDQIRF